MKRHLGLIMLLCSVAGGALAEESSMCKSLCASEQRSCRAQALNATALDIEPLVNVQQTQGMARFADEGRNATAPVRAAERDDFSRRRVERTDRCDTSFQRCVRTCGTANAAPGTSEVLTKQGQARRSATQGQAR